MTGASEEEEETVVPPVVISEEEEAASSLEASGVEVDVEADSPVEELPSASPPQEAKPSKTAKARTANGCFFMKIPP